MYMLGTERVYIMNNNSWPQEKSETRQEHSPAVLAAICSKLLLTLSDSGTDAT